jgi:signal-transduction protein with cAMP-binding, CBS, and nucleotidyltransferase domain
MGQELEIKSFLNKISPLPKEAWKILAGKLEREKFDKGAVFQEFRVPAPKIAFIVGGVFKVEQFDPVSGQPTVIFFNEPEKTKLVGVLESLLKQVVSDVRITSVVDAVVYQVDYKVIEALYDQFSKVDRLGRKIMEKQYLLALEQARFRQQTVAKEKFFVLKNQLGKYFDLVSKQDRASFIGIDPSSFSRLLKKIN